MPAATVPVDRAVKALVQRLLALGETPQGMGVTELKIREAVNECVRVLEAAILERQSQKIRTACPDCGERLVGIKERRRKVRTVHGEIRVKRGYGYCRCCKHWVAPADRVWGLEDAGELSPLLRDIVTWMATIAPLGLAAEAVEKALGMAVGLSHVEREAKRAGARAEAYRQEQTAAALDVEGRKTVGKQARKRCPRGPFVLVVMIDGWMISERWEWREVKSATVFRLDQRGRSGKRPIITQREYVGTRKEPDEMSKLVWAAAMRCGLLDAQRVLFIADGAPWIWSIRQDRFSDAQGVLDFTHATDHLWVVANEVFGEGTDQARQWVEPLRHRLRHGSPLPVIESLSDLTRILRRSKARPVVERAIRYLETHRDHINYVEYEKAGYPLGSGAMESTCKQFQTRFKRPGQFWIQPGAEKLLCLASYRMSGRWNELWPHLQEAA